MKVYLAIKQADYGSLAPGACFRIADDDDDPPRYGLKLSTKAQSDGAECFVSLSGPRNAPTGRVSEKDPAIYVGSSVASACLYEFTGAMLVPDILTLSSNPPKSSGGALQISGDKLFLRAAHNHAFALVSLDDFKIHDVNLGRGALWIASWQIVVPQIEPGKFTPIFEYPPKQA